MMHRIDISKKIKTWLIRRNGGVYNPNEAEDTNDAGQKPGGIQRNAGDGSCGITEAPEKIQ